MQVALVCDGYQSMSYDSYWDFVRSCLDGFYQTLALKTSPMQLPKKCKSAPMYPLSASAASQQGSFCLSAWLLERSASDAMDSVHMTTIFDLR